MKDNIFITLGVILSLLCLRVDAAILNVPADYPTVQGAIDNAVEADTVLLAPGTYLERVFIEHVGLTLASEFLFSRDEDDISSTILAAPPEQLDSIWRVVTIGPDLEDPVYIVGLTIQDGRTHQEELYNAYGAGVYARQAEVHLNNNVFTDNYADRGGGAGFDTCTVFVEQNIFTNNEARVAGGYGGGFYARGGMVHLIENVFELNIAWAGGGAFVRNATGELRGNRFIQNTATMPAGGTYIGHDASTWIITDNLFEGNIASSGAGLLTGNDMDSLLILRNTFRRNQANNPNYGDGGALELEYNVGYVLVRKNIFEENEAYFFGSSIFAYRSCDIVYNVFIRNHAPDGSVIKTGTRDDIEVTAEHNLIMGNGLLPPYGYWNRGDVTAGWSSTINLHFNDFIGNEDYAAGVDDELPGTIHAQDNYWGDPSGPYHELENPGGLGDSVRSNVSILPFSTDPFTGPRNFDLDQPQSGEVLFELPLLFTWYASQDALPGGPLTYTLQIAEDEEFEDPQVYEAGADTFFNLEEGLEFERLHLWRVYAENDYGQRAWSTETGDFSLTGVAEQRFTGIPHTWGIEAVYPNPFNSAVFIVLGVPQVSTETSSAVRESVRVEIFDLLGRRVALLHDGPLSPGHYTFRWSAPGASGVYLLHASSGTAWSTTRKILALK